MDTLLFIGCRHLEVNHANINIEYKQMRMK